MKKIQRAKKEKSQHVLAKLREVINASQKSAPDDLGIPTDTCASIESGRLPFSEAIAGRVSSWTGISPGCLLRGDANLTRIDGKPYNKDVFERVRFERESVIAPARKQGNECFSLYLRLCIHLGKVMLAAADAKDSKFAAWKLRDDLCKVGRKYPAFGNDVPGIMTSQTGPEIFSMVLQSMLNQGTKPKKLWATLLDRFHKELCAIESRQAKAAKKPTAKSAKPTRRN